MLHLQMGIAAQHWTQLMSYCSHHCLNDAKEEEGEEEEEVEEEEENWLHKLVYAALVGLSFAYTLKCSNISLCLSSITLVES